MLLLVVSYLAGALTILSPCILPVLPLVFSKAQSSFWRNRFPLLLGMALTFSFFSSLAIVGGEWIGRANEIGRWLALVLMSLFGLSLLFPRFTEFLMSPLSNLGAKLGQSANDNSPRSSLLIGISTGLLWAPCAGPILGLILTGAASQESAGSSFGLLVAYSLGAATSLSLALTAGNRLLKKFKNVLGMDKFVKKGIGLAVLFGVVMILFKLDQTLLTQLSKISTDSIENKLLTAAGLQQKDKHPTELPPLPLDTPWINSSPLDVKALKGKVVLIDFWTYSCINCLRTLPHLKSWHEKYKNSGLVIIGVHTPEFAFEKKIENVQAAITDLGITYPVTIDNSYQIWRTFKNRYWPAHYFVDRQGKIRHHHFGEGKYDESESILRKLLAEDGTEIQTTESELKAEGVLQPSVYAKVKSPETYLGYSRLKNFINNTAPQKDSVHNYVAPEKLQLNEWSLTGSWKIEKERAIAQSANTKITFQFQARDLHLVLGAAKTPIIFKVTIDGQAPGKNHGTDTDESGQGQIKDHRLYQLLRLQDDPTTTSHTFEIEFMERDAEAYAFTFG